MLRKFLIICSAALITFSGVHAEEQNSPAKRIQLKSEVTIPSDQQMELKSEEESEESTLAQCAKCGHKKGRKHVTAGVEAELACDCHVKKKGRKIKPAGDEADQTPVAACAKCGHKKNRKDLTPGVLVCNSREDKCLKEEGDDKETETSNLFATFCDDAQDEQNLLACKDCR